MKYSPAQIRKALTAVATAVSQALALGLLPAPVDKYAAVLLGVLGAFGVFALQNAPVEA